MKTLFLFRAEILSPPSHTLPFALVYASELSEAKEKAKTIFARDYGKSNYRINDNLTKTFHDPRNAENGIGPGCGIVNSLNPPDLLPFLRDYAEFRAGRPKTRGSDFDAILEEELQKRVVEERIASRKENTSQNPVLLAKGRSNASRQSN
jgi:hypothetical protein